MFVSELLFGKSSIPVASEVIRMTEVRHKELVNNIANVETPYYKARDINVNEFRSVLSAAIDERKAQHPWLFGLRSGRDIQAARSSYDFNMRSIEDVSEGHIATGYKVRERHDDSLMRHDQNTVTIEGEMARLGQNAALHRTFETLARDNFKMIETALRMRM